MIASIGLPVWYQSFSFQEIKKMQLFLHTGEYNGDSLDDNDD